ncbi:hypothetical protein CY34DRAFT_109084 [Suillus luteus UH-Slu-Lm8-n1]|uniref:Uncharacterized protein n=1 Tax=Suillus luteus UH-Slu-Lm8-n1 TaxID=930992 RepID=A0A0D0A768_9AGAM|nr:hypothetical protein CY34DRAFT_109084 [Suillus luteus UH-Slu-Lm8-n1]
MSAPRAHRKVVQASRSSNDQLSCTSEVLQSISTPEIPPHIFPPPIFSNDGYISMSPNLQGDVPALRMSRFSDGVVFRDKTMGIKKSMTQQYSLPPVRPPRESLVSDLDPTPIATACCPTTMDTSVVSSISEADLKPIVKDAKNSVIVETLNKCGFYDSSSRLTVVQHTLTNTYSYIITSRSLLDQMIKYWVSENISKLYKSAITPMSTILNHFKQSAQDLIENLYNLILSIWTNSMVQTNHNQTTIKFLTSNDSINFIFGNQIRLEDGQEFYFSFKYEAIIQIVLCAAFCDGHQPQQHHGIIGNSCMLQPVQVLNWYFLKKLTSIMLLFTGLSNVAI